MNVSNSDVFCVVNMYHDHLMLYVCVLMVESMSVVVNILLSLLSVMSQPPTLCNISVRMVVTLFTLDFFFFRGEFGISYCV